MARRSMEESPFWDHDADLRGGIDFEHPAALAGSTA
jgi:hypothetical protein